MCTLITLCTFDTEINNKALIMANEISEPMVTGRYEIPESINRAIKINAATMGYGGAKPYIEALINAHGKELIEKQPKKEKK